MRLIAATIKYKRGIRHMHTAPEKHSPYRAFCEPSISRYLLSIVNH